jgi:hypothetical protein
VSAANQNPFHIHDRPFVSQAEGSNSPDAHQRQRVAPDVAAPARASGCSKPRKRWPARCRPVASKVIEIDDAEWNSWPPARQAEWLERHDIVEEVDE